MTFAQLALAAFCAAVGVNCLIETYLDWLNRCGTSYMLRDAAMGVTGLVAAIAVVTA